MDKTKQVLKEMLTENTGQSFLDSGGTPTYDSSGNYIGSSHGYGRHYEENKSIDFDETEEATVTFDTLNNDIDVTVSLYHWLLRQVSYNEKYDKMFHETYVEEVDPDDDQTWFELANGFAAWLMERGYTVSGQWDIDNIYPVNTYNGNSVLSQVIQYVYMDVTTDGENWDSVIILQIHNGTDVRGGYTKPRIFSANEDGIGSSADAQIYCANDYEHNWVTDDGYHWYFGGTYSGIRLEEHRFETVDDWKEENDGKDPFEVPFVDPNQMSFDFYDKVKIEGNYYKAKGIVLVDDDGRGYCPFCGGMLIASQ